MKKIPSHTKILAVMAQQTTDCAYFIRDYATKGFCMSTCTLILRKLTILFLNLGKQALENTFNKTVDSKIREYENKFRDLKDAFQGRAVLQTEITVSRILGIVDSLGKQIYLFLSF